MTPDTLSPDVLAELAKLRDIRVPDPVGWWPLALGWWGVMILAVLLICSAVFFALRRRRSLGFIALGELKLLNQRLSDDGDPQQISIDLAVLLRRISMSSQKRREAVNLSGAQWAEKLTMGDHGFTPQTADFLVRAPYAPPGEKDIHPALKTALSETERWIRSYAP